MYQLMTPHLQIVNEMQICAPQYVYSRQVAQPQQEYLVSSSNVVSPNHPHLTSMQCPRYLPKLAVASTMTCNRTPQNGNVLKKPISDKGSVTHNRFFKISGGDPYGCHFLGQLEGHYQTDAPSSEFIEIKLAIKILYIMLSFIVKILGREFLIYTFTTRPRASCSVL